MSFDVAAVVLAGVHDWGACPLNQAVVRPLAPIANRPVVEYALGALASIGVQHAVICANGHGRIMQDALDTVETGIMSLSFRDDGMPRGPAGCVKDAAATVSAADIIVIEASVIPYFDLADMLRCHRESRASLTIATRRDLLGGEQSQYPVGVYVFSRAAIQHIPDSGFEDIKEATVPKLHAAGLRTNAHSIDGAAPRLSGIGSYFALNEWVLKLMQNGSWKPEDYQMRGDALVHIDAHVDETARCLGPVMIGPGSIIREQAIIVGPTAIDRDCIVGDGAVVSRSALWTDSVVGAKAHVDRCVVASGARVGAGDEHFNAIHLPAKTGPKRTFVRSSRRDDEFAVGGQAVETHATRKV